MQTSDAYSLLVRELEAIRQLPARDLVALVERPALERVVEVGGELIEIELLATWQDKAHSAVRVTGHARGPSTWHHQHLQESIAVTVPSGASNGA